MKSRPRTAASTPLVQPQPRFQHTIARAAVVEGFGFWSSRDVRVEFRPAQPNTGVVFVRGDLNPAVRIPAAVERRIETPRRTALVHGAGRVEMVEHILASLAGLQIDNCEVWVNESEMPGCDGSSLAFVEALEAAGIVRQQAIRATLVVRETVRLGNEESWILANPPEQPGLALQFRIEYPHCPSIGRQTYKLAITPNSFRKQLASCRTFLTRQEAEWLRSQKLASRATTKEALVFDADGPVDNELRFDDECVRHKMLDLVGDLALAGCDIVGQVAAHCSGHRLNAELVRVLLAEGEKLQPWLRCA
ncbi:MAG: UDP-3-O-[3-hydroxymyristoyl] N-acetylglucosamine deacetylase [Planctomycetota bacterium]|nr:MAG: UDP-3-O-[3-hydroxymyristoyl] N-acetylglucosamine deacetylase [Planctomycetota bacterium]